MASPTRSICGTARWAPTARVNTRASCRRSRPSKATTFESSVSRAERFGLAVALALGVLVRLIPVLGAAGAVGDGGLIHSMVDDVRAASLAIPFETSYNSLDIPFVY